MANGIFAKYRAKFTIPPEESINIELFTCTPKPIQAPRPKQSEEEDDEDEDDAQGTENETQETEPSVPVREPEIYQPDKGEEFIFQ